MKRDCVNHTKETDAHWGSGANKRPVLPNSLPRPGCVSSGRLYNLSEFCSSIKRISQCAAFQGWLLDDLGIDLALDLSSVTEGRLSLEVIRGVSLSSLESKGLRGMCIRQVPRTLARAEASSLLLSVPRGGPRLDIPGGLVCLSPSLRQWMSILIRAQPRAAPWSLAFACLLWGLPTRTGAFLGVFAQTGAQAGGRRQLRFLCQFQQFQIRMFP